MPTQVQPPPQDHHHDLHGKNANALHRDALMQALGSILAPKRPTMTGRSSSLSTVESSRSSSGTASPAHEHPSFPHPHAHSPPPPPPPPHSTPVPHSHSHPHSPLHPHTHAPSPLAESASVSDVEDPIQDAHSEPSPMASIAGPIPRNKIIDSLKSKNSAWDALIHGSFS
ncbi:hypothetical protein R3P38DRAFT_2932169 [Favolaschia claudopus]|uniref:Uncharacterized protein n=1 Tax=Favolaschia claudopus TaxID=2862362 RepID=A0AAW0BUR9_9AGAR